MYSIIRNNVEKFKTFNINKHIMEIQIGTSTNNHPCDMTFIFNDILDKYLIPCKKTAPPASKIGLRIEFEGMTIALFIEYRHPSDISGELIMERMFKIMQSNKKINLNKLTIEATYFKAKSS